MDENRLDQNELDKKWVYPQNVQEVFLSSLKITIRKTNKIILYVVDNLSSAAMAPLLAEQVVARLYALTEKLLTL